MTCQVPKGKAIRGMIIVLLGEWTRLYQVLEGGRRSPSHVAQGGLAPHSVRKRTKALLGKQYFCIVRTDGTDTVLTFLQGLGHRTDPLEGRFMSDSQVTKLEFTGKHISPFTVGPRVEMPT